MIVKVTLILHFVDHTYRSFLSGYRLNNNEGTGLWLQELVIGIRQKHRDGFQAHKKEDPLTTISRVCSVLSSLESFERKAE